MEVTEYAGQVNVTIAVLGDMLADNAEVIVRLHTQSGTAIGQLHSPVWWKVNASFVWYLMDKAVCKV